MTLKTLVPDAEGYLSDAKTGERIVFYECDPLKNCLCPKTMCRPKADEENAEQIGFCSCTTEPAFRKNGGRAFYKRKNEEGWFGREYVDEEDSK